MKRASFIVSVLVLMGTAAGAGDRISDGVAPQTPVLVGEPQETYGTGSLTVFTIPSTNFTARQSTTAYQTGGGIERFLSAGGAFDAAAMLPNGAQIERLELRACDTDAAAEVSVVLAACPTIGGGCTIPGGVGTGATPGCNDFSTTLAAPVVVNNQTTPIVVEVTTGTTSATTFSAVKIYYRLRVSPAPAVATFTDVPVGHPQLRFVEALVAAGITGGCGAGVYCPDSAVTRGQMAVFLAVALGLHFPN